MPRHSYEVFLIHCKGKPLRSFIRARNVSSGNPARAAEPRDTITVLTDMGVPKIPLYGGVAAAG
jgi:hypothetical protein